MAGRAALCALKARYPRQRASSSVNVRNVARRKAAETLALASGRASPKAEVTGSNPVGSAIFFNSLLNLSFSRPNYPHQIPTITKLKLTIEPP